MDRRYHVFVSSTYEDLREERREVMQALLALDCIPTGMELFPEGPTTTLGPMYSDLSRDAIITSSSLAVGTDRRDQPEEATRRWNTTMQLGLGSPR
jgi:hypothetical protein